MVNVGGVTYRIEEDAGLNLVVRLRDDRPVGVFRWVRGLAIAESSIGGEPLLSVARMAVRAGKVRSTTSGACGGSTAFPSGIGPMLSALRDSVGLAIRMLAERLNRFSDPLGAHRIRLK